MNNYIRKGFFALFLQIIIFSFLLLSPQVIHAAINEQLGFQGKVSNTANSTPVSGDYDFVFKIYSVSTGGTPLWIESRTGVNKVPVSNGSFTVSLGSVNPFAGNIDFSNENLYLGIDFNNDGEMSPRLRLTAVPYAFNSKTVSGLNVTPTNGTLTIGNDKTVEFSDDFSTVGNYSLSLNLTANTDVTLPTSGTLSTLDGSEVLNNKSIGSSGLVFVGSTTDIQADTGEGLLFLGNNDSIFETTDGEIYLQPSGSSISSLVQIGDGAGSTTPDFLRLDIKSTSGDPVAGSAGSLYYNLADNKFRCYEDSAWTDCISSGSSTVALSNIANSYSISFDGTLYWALSNSGLTDYSNVSLKTVVEDAVNDLNAVGGGAIVFQDGTFDLGTENLIFNTKNDIVFQGQGIDATILQNSTDAIADTEPLSFTNSKRITVRDITISAGGTYRSTSDAIDFDNGEEVLVERVKIINSRSRGIVIDGKDLGYEADRNIIRDCIITGIPDDGIELLASNENTVEGCKIYDIGGHGIQINKASPASSQPNKKSNYNTIRANNINNVGKDGINIVSSNFNIVSNNIVVNSADETASRDGIRLDSVDSQSCDNNIFTNNISTDDQDIKTQRYGVNISSALCNNNLVSNNYLEGNNISQINDLGNNTQYSQYINNKQILSKVGNVGIGTTDPNAPLEILNSSTQLRLSYSTGVISTLGVDSDGYLTIQSNGDFAGRLQLGSGGTGSNTPDLLGLDVKSTSGDPAGFNGAIYYNAYSGKFRCYEADAWADCIGSGGGVSVPQTITFLAQSSVTWSSQPAGLTELLGNTRQRVQIDLSNISQMRLIANIPTAGAAGAELRVQYSTNLSTWDYLDGISGPSVTIDSNGLRVSSYVNIDIGAKSDVYLRIVGINGNGSASPILGTIYIQIK